MPWKVVYLESLYGTIEGTRSLLHLAKETDFKTWRAWRHWLFWKIWLR